MTAITPDTIIALATGQGGAIAILRMSGPDAIPITDRIFTAKSGKKLADQKGFTVHYGEIKAFADDPSATSQTVSGESICPLPNPNASETETVDDVLITLFRAPHSYTGEDMVEISCHASPYIEQEIIRVCTGGGARAAQPGEFTLRAFLAGKLDLSQAEAVADVIAAESKLSHRMATRQIRGGYSEEFAAIRAQLLDLVSLLELELDFGEEDVEFADRTRLREMMHTIEEKIVRLKESFRLGNILKNGVPVAIVGSPNVGKSTLMNALAQDEKALVSDIAGTTRDVIEDTVYIDDILFRFIDTAGIRDTDDPLENLGIERTFARMEQAAVILLICDVRESLESIRSQVEMVDRKDDQTCLLVLNKADTVAPPELETKTTQLQAETGLSVIGISAKIGQNLPGLTGLLRSTVDISQLDRNETIIYNSRHNQALQEALTAIERAGASLENDLPGDLLSQDIREVLHHLGTITGEITDDDILGHIFSKFCIGK